MARRLYWASLALTPVVLAARYLFHANGAVLFVLASAALTPLAFLIGEATENLSEHTGPGIGGFLNASFGNAPELIIGIFAIRDGLPSVVLATIAGSVVSTALIVLGVAIVYGGGGHGQPALARPPDRRADRRGLPLPHPIGAGLARRPRPPQPLPADAPGRGGAAPALPRRRPPTIFASTGRLPARARPRAPGACGAR